LQREDSAIKNVSAILVVTSKIVDYKFIKLSKLLTLDIHILSKEYLHGYQKGVVLVKNQDVEKITVNVIALALSVENNANV
jgi:hypothetical protein